MIVVERHRHALTDSKAVSTSHSGTISLRSTGPAKGPDPLLESEYRRTLLLTRDMGQECGKSVRPFLYNDVLVSFFINRLFAIFAKYDFRHLRKLPLIRVRAFGARTFRKLFYERPLRKFQLRPFQT